MPIHDLGYRPWDEPPTSDHSRWRVLTEAGVRQAWRIAAVRRMVLFSWGPAVLAMVLLFFIEQATSRPEVRRGLIDMLNDMPASTKAMIELDKGPDAARHVLWSYTLMIFFRYPQGIAMLLLIGVVGPPLISRDVRSRAFLLYFSRPLSRVQYLLGKAAVLGWYMLLITALPALVVYLVGIMMSPELSVILRTWDMPLRIVAASLVLIVPTASLMLCMSSLTTESRNASFAWYIVWVLGFVAYTYMTMVEAAMEMRATGAQQIPLELVSKWTLVSPYHMLGKVQGLVFGLEGLDSPMVVPSLAMLTLITALCLCVLFRRVSAPMRV